MHTDFDAALLGQNLTPEVETALREAATNPCWLRRR